MKKWWWFFKITYSALLHFLRFYIWHSLPGCDLHFDVNNAYTVGECEANIFVKIIIIYFLKINCKKSNSVKVACKNVSGSYVVLSRVYLLCHARLDSSLWLRIFWCIGNDRNSTRVSRRHKMGQIKYINILFAVLPLHLHRHCIVFTASQHCYIVSDQASNTSERLI